MDRNEVQIYTFIFRVNLRKLVKLYEKNLIQYLNRIFIEKNIKISLSAANKKNGKEFVCDTCKIKSRKNFPGFQIFLDYMLIYLL